jgi:hypothetical protein
MGFDRHGEGLYLPSKATGGTYPTEMAKRLFAHIYEEKAPPEPIRKPLGVTVVRLDGMALWNEFRVVQASPLTPDNYVQTEYFTTDTVPHETSDYWSIPRTPCITWDASIMKRGALKKPGENWRKPLNAS